MVLPTVVGVRLPASLSSSTDHRGKFSRADNDALSAAWQCDFTLTNLNRQNHPHRARIWRVARRLSSGGGDLWRCAGSSEATQDCGEIVRWADQQRPS